MATYNETEYSFVAAIFGVTGVVGSELARQLLISRKWKVYGIARSPPLYHYILDYPNYFFISCDLLNSGETHDKISRMKDLTHVFWVTWASQFNVDSPECFDQNKFMMSNMLNAILPSAKELKHISLQTGTKYYVSLQGSESINGLFDENSSRSSHGLNHYHGLEDLLQERLPGYKVPWSILRCGLLLGCSNRAFCNTIGSLCVYGTICRYLNLPFLFGGTKECWEEMHLDLADARLVAEQHIWAVTNNGEVEEEGQVFNVVNGKNYSWKEVWGAIGTKLGANHVSSKELFSEDFAFSSAMADKGDVWKEIVVKEGLVHTDIEDLANWDFLDLVFRLPFKMLASRDKADRMGFNRRYSALDSISHWIDVMRAAKFIP